jgi:MoaA/NifB/PqqE/SkfB family radical SAM enzyme
LTAVYWDITERCNAGCLYCSARHARRDGPRADAPLAAVRAALARLRAAGAGTVVFLGGEPTLRPDLPRIARAALDCGLTVGIATNGQALGSEMRGALLESGPIAINVSLDSAFAEENDAVRGAGYHARALSTLRALLAERHARASVTIQATLTTVNLPRLEESLLRLLDLGVDRVLVERMRSYSSQSAEVRSLAPAPAAWVAGAESVARAAARSGAPDRLLLNYGHAALKARLAARYGFPAAPERFCPGGLGVAIVDGGGFLHPCRHALEGAAPQRAEGGPWFSVRPISVHSPEAARFLESPYFVDFYNFAHSARVYERLAECRACPHYAACEPCPLDVAAYGERVLAECRCVAALDARDGAGA